MLRWFYTKKFVLYNPRAEKRHRLWVCFCGFKFEIVAGLFVLAFDRALGRRKSRPAAWAGIGLFELLAVETPGIIRAVSGSVRRQSSCFLHETRHDFNFGRFHIIRRLQRNRDLLAEGGLATLNSPKWIARWQSRMEHLRTDRNGWKRISTDGGKMRRRWRNHDDICPVEKGRMGKRKGFFHN